MRNPVRTMLLTCAAIPAAVCLLFAPGFGQGKAHIRTAHNVKSSLIAGSYTRIKQRKDENKSAVLDVKQISGSRIHFHLTALMWPVGNSDAPHNGEIEADVTLQNRVAVYKKEDYRLTMRFANHTIVVTEKGSNPDFGAYVSASGTYRLTNKARTH